MSDCCAADARDSRQRRLLWIVLVLNAVMFVVEFAAGWIANSSALLADSLDMLADALVYSVSLYAVGKAAAKKARAALLNGSLQMTLGIWVLIDVAWRTWSGSTPSAELMAPIALLAFAVNAACFLLLYSYRRGDLNMRASWICSRNDLLANLGVLIAAGLVAWRGEAWPDLLVGTIIAVIVIYSAWRIIGEARTAIKTGDSVSDGCCGS